MSRLLTFLLYLVLCIVSIAAAAFGVMNYLTLTRGIEPNYPATAKLVGTNVALEQYTSDAALERALEQLQNAHITAVRQYFPWREIEAQRGQYDWTKWDRIVRAAQEHGLTMVAVLYTAPAWSQRPNEKDMPGAPADDFQEYARFTGDFAKRYANAIDYYQIWDEPNVEPNWGRRNADPTEYAQMLIPASEAIRANDPNAQILLAGLAMNGEVHRPHPEYSEILFLRGLFQIGAQKYFDIVAAKPYGMWTGPEDRRVNSDTLNYSRLILLRDEMRQYGDAAKPVWLVELGWNALPANWTGAPSPWGTDTEQIQSDRLVRGLARADVEWNWVTGLFPLYLQPNVPANDPRWGFAMFTPDFQPRPFYPALQNFLLNDPIGALWATPPALPWFSVILLAGVAVVSAWRIWVNAFALRLDARWRGLQAHLIALPELAQFVIVLLTAAAFYFSPSVPLNFILLALLVAEFMLRLDLALALIIFVIPFWNFPKTLFGAFDLAPSEVFTWAATAAWILNFLLLDARHLSIEKIKRIVTEFSAIDWSVLAFLALSLLSTRWAGNFGVASREFRIIILDPILMYGLLRTYGRRQTTDDESLPSPHHSSPVTRLFVSALLASGIAVCAIGLYQLATGDTILADGVARIYAVWGSPNNVGLYLGRLLPLTLAFALMLRPMPRARWVYAALTVLFAAVIFLTYSRGALFLGVPASVLFLLAVLYTQAHKLSRRAWFALAGAIVIGAALIGVVIVLRGSDLFQEGTGTGFFRIAVWTSAVEMIRDHPLLGVGLDNFLYEYPKYILPEAWREPNLSHPHNILLDFWTSLGIGGVALGFWMILAFFRRAWHSFKTTGDLYTRALMLGLMASMVDLLAHGLIDEAYFVMDLAYVFMLTLALAQTDDKSMLSS